MANVITQFLVGLGITYDNKGAKDIDRALDSVGDAAKKAGAELDSVGDNLDESVRRGTESSKSRIASLVSTFKAAGFAMAGVAAGVGSAWAFESDKAKQAYALNNQLATSQFSPTEVYGLGALTEQRGGDRQEATSSLLNLERGINRLQMGDAGLIQQLAVAGIRVDNPTQRSREDIASDIMGQFQRLDTTRQSNVAETLGLDPATVRVWQEFGSTTLDVAKSKALELGYTEKHNAALNQINQTILDTQQKMEGLGNSVADVLAPSIQTLATELLSMASGIAGWIKNNPDIINSVVSGSWYDSIQTSADNAAKWVKDKTGFDPQSVGRNFDTLSANATSEISSGASANTPAPAWGGTPFWANKDNWINTSDNRQVSQDDLMSLQSNNSLYQPEASPVADNYAQQSQQLNQIMQGVNRPIQVNSTTRAEGDVVLDGNAIGRYAVNHFETQVYPQTIDNTQSRSY